MPAKHHTSRAAARAGALLALFYVAGALAPAMAAPVVKADARLARSLMRLDPAQRFQQLCDVAAMKVISRSERGMRPDRTLLDAISIPARRGDTLAGNGAAIRSKGTWRRFSFSCAGSPEQLIVRRFTYKLGATIPEAHWERYNLWR